LKLCCTAALRLILLLGQQKRQQSSGWAPNCRLFCFHATERDGQSAQQTRYSLVKRKRTLLLSSRCARRPSSFAYIAETGSFLCLLRLCKRRKSHFALSVYLPDYNNFQDYCQALNCQFSLFYHFFSLFSGLFS
jgi:hypothetical protein